MPNQKLEADRRLIKALTDCEPLDWTRRNNGDLVYLNEAGQKFILADAEIQKLTDAALARKRRTEPVEVKAETAPAKRSAERVEAKAGLAPEKKSAEPVETKSDPDPSAADRSSLQEQGAETPEESQPQVDITKGDIKQIKGTD
jgi:hypothetical protein